MKKFFNLLLVFILTMVVISGCQSNGPKTKTTKGDSTTTELTFMDVSPSPVRQTYYETIFKKFEEETGIKVVYQSVPWDDAANKLTVLGAANQLPDVMTTWAGWLGQYVPAGWVIPLNDYIGDTKGEYTDVVNDIIWKTEKELHGNIYTVPDGLMVKGVFIRKDWAKEEGITLDPDNWTYDDYFDVVKKFTNTEKKRYGSSYRGARGAFDPLLVYMQTFTGGRTYDEQGNSLINSPDALKAFEKWTNVYLDGYAAKDSINWGFVEMVDNFTGGLTGTLINDSEVAATCESKMDPEQWTVMPMPKSTVDGKIYNTINSPYAYTISGDSKDPDLSWKLIEFLVRPDNNIEYCKLTGLIPIKRDVGDDKTYGEDGPYSAFVKQLNNPALVVPTTYGPMDITDLHQGLLHEEIQKYLLGNQDAKTSLSNISKELEKRMKDYLKENPDGTVEKPKSIK